MISEPLIDRASKKPSVVLASAVLMPHGQPAGAVGGSFELDSVSLFSNLGQGDQRDGSRTLVMRRKGVLLAHTDPARLLGNASEEPGLAEVFQHVEDERERRQDETPALLAQLEAVVDYRLTWEGNTFAVGASIGLVRVDGAFSDAKEVLAAAGNACYTAKHQGRNRVVVFGE